MGIQERDYYREDYAKKNGMRYDWMRAVYSPKVFRRRSASGDGLPNVPGSSWHWATQVLAWLLVMGLLFLAFKVFERKREDSARLNKQVAQQQAVIEEQRRQIEALKPKPTPKVDFFK